MSFFEAIVELGGRRCGLLADLSTVVETGGRKTSVMGVVVGWMRESRHGSERRLSWRPGLPDSTWPVDPHAHACLALS
jgi:hypothetical protein